MSTPAANTSKKLTPGNDEDLTSSVFCAATVHTYLSPFSFDDVRCNDNLCLFSEVPLLDHDGLVFKCLVYNYNIGDWLTGDIPVSCVTSRSGLHSLCCGPGYLLFSGIRTVAGSRRYFNIFFYYGLFRLHTVI